MGMLEVSGVPGRIEGGLRPSLRAVATQSSALAVRPRRFLLWGQHQQRRRLRQCLFLAPQILFQLANALPVCGALARGPPPVSARQHRVAPAMHVPIVPPRGTCCGSTGPTPLRPSAPPPARQQTCRQHSAVPDSGRHQGRHGLAHERTFSAAFATSTCRPVVAAAATAKQLVSGDDGPFRTNRFGRCLNASLMWNPARISAGCGFRKSNPDDFTN